MKLNNKIIIDPNLLDDIILWRYMSLEKFINLVDSKAIFLSPILYFRNSDPLEGHLPKKFHIDMENAFRSMRISSKQDYGDMHNEMKDWLNEWEATSDLRLELMKEKSRDRQSICCWYESPFESEAMWKLYGDNGKSIAIKTTVGTLKKSIESQDNDKLVFLNRVKYLNFDDLNLEENEILENDKAIASILLKRKEYEHEKEVRLYHKPDEHDLFNPQHTMFTDYWESYTIKPHFVNVNINEMIHDIVISPFVSEPYESSVKAICSKYELNNCKVYKSTLLDKYDF
ncbi:Protein of uncharacterised function (DUF2971) [Yersinia intermedia]|uniref:DUF2971 domain-containing protein n=1 Tax=Yersinia intermedia TaxID=631 RepID=UPI0005DB6D55|nr:DUF2971 domain-containing protein [Yersinia intermedia]CNB50048.1 Protein of uncharacterised function (DUF2971) [Yersinia intermedia]CNF81885.1 Protein of uncharacterised function (DUF2971) [Yersinia intermedia]